ncbi:MAG: type II CAAX endopeptidase family protein [Saprospiraceae bacterium]
MFLKNAHIGENKWPLYLATIVLVIVGTIIGQVPLAVVLEKTAADNGVSQSDYEEMIRSMDFSSLGLDQNLTVFLMLLAFVVGLLFLWIGVRFIHKKPFEAIVTSSLKTNWKKIFFSFGLWMALTIVLEFIFYLLQPDIYTFQFQADKFLILLLIALFVFPLQTSFEELMFRGYLMQGISLLNKYPLFKYRWMPLILTSVGFGVMHIMNPEVEAFGLELSMTYYIGVGLFLGILTLMDDGLELALGVHAATNIYSALFVTFDDSAVQTSALFHTSEVNMGWMLAGFFVAAIAFIRIVSQKYNWGSWKHCFGEIETPQNEDEIVFES